MKTIFVGLIFGIIGGTPLLTMLYTFAPQYFEPPITSLIGFVCGWVGTEIAIRNGF